MLIRTGAFSGQAEWRRLSHAIQSQVRIAPDSSSMAQEKSCVNYIDMAANMWIMGTMKPQTLVKYFGSQTKAANALGYTRAAVSQWVKKGELPRNVQKHFASYRMAWGKYEG